MKTIPTLAVLATTCSLALAETPASDEEPLRRIAFGSCFKEGKKGTIFSHIASSNPQLFIWLGDNIYGDSADPSILRAKWQTLASHPDVKPALAGIPQIATWDDHDYGRNDAGKELQIKNESQNAFLDWLGVPDDSPKRSRKGVYSVHDYGPKDRKVRIILLDTRYHRDPLPPEHRRPPRGPGSDGTILGEDQWRWLEEQLRTSTAQINIIGSSIQVLAAEHRFEKWANYPEEFARLHTLLSRPDIPPVIILSGDRHAAEISLDDESCGYPIYDITSSSLNHAFLAARKKQSIEPNPLRLSPERFKGANFGTISIDWSTEPPIVTLAIRDRFAAPQRSVTFSLGKTKSPTH